MVMAMMGLHFILNEKVSFSNQYPLLSAYDVRDILIRVYSKKKYSTDQIIEQMRKRHDQRGLEKIKKNSS